MTIWIDGQYCEREDARISVFDHGLLYGDGVFEGIRIYAGTAFRLGEHLRRLYDSARAIALEIPLSPEAMERTVTEAVEREGKREGYIRLVVTRGVGDLGLDPGSCPLPTVIVIVDSIRLYPEEYYRDGIPIVTAASRRLGPDEIDPRIKSLNYLNNILAKIEARNAGCIEAVMLNREGFIAECTADNLFLIRDGRLATPSVSEGALEGITRGFVLELAEGLGIPVSERRLSRYDLYAADECFLTGTGAEIVPVISADGRPIGTGAPGSLTGRIAARFRETVDARVEP